VCGVVAGARTPVDKAVLAWAARTAVASRKPLVVCHAYGHQGASDLREARAARDRAWRRAEEGAAFATAAVPEVEAHPWAAAGPVVEVLRNAVRSPSWYVVAARGNGVLLGLVDAAAGTPTTPVVLVRRRGPAAAFANVPPDSGQVIVGVDGTAWGTVLVSRALEIAAGLGAGLVAVPVPSSAPMRALARRPAELATSVSRPFGTGAAPPPAVVEDLVAEQALAWPWVEVTIADGDGTIAGPLRIARPSDLLAVGSLHGSRAGVAERLGSALGCVALNRARCPVALVPIPAECGVPRIPAPRSWRPVAGTIGGAQAVGGAGPARSATGP